MATYEDNVIPITRNRQSSRGGGGGALPKLMLVAGLALLISEQTRTSGIVLLAAGVLLTLSRGRPSMQAQASDLHRQYMPTGETIQVETEKP
jgi:hypothetical protein